MALVGSIRVGTISGLVDSLKRTNVQATLTVRSGEDEGVLTFRQGELETCAMDVLEDADALDEMLTWSHGQFTLRIIDASAEADGLAPKGAHVMVVDDELGVRKLIESFLEAQGYRVSVVSQASQAVNLVEYCRPDLVLLDVMLTGIDGFELASLLRQQYDDRALPIVMMSANHEFKAKADERGYPFFGKPFDFKKLCARIDALTGAPADRAIAERLRVSAPSGAAAAAPGRSSAPSGLSNITLPTRLATLLDAESFLPDLDQCYVLDEVARARFALVQADPTLAALVAGFDGFQSLRLWLAEDPDSRDQRVLVTLLLLAVDALRTADTAFGT